MDYRDVTGRITADRVVICLDSLPRLSVTDIQPDPEGGLFGVPVARRWDLVLLDESEQTIRHLDGAANKNHQGPFPGERV